MLQFLSVKNFALIENSEINFANGLNIITGETGSGKSIIIQALAILLGGRASMEHIRSGMEEAVLNATIDIKGLDDLVKNLAEAGITCDQDELIIRRILTNTGKSRSFINGVQVTSKEMSYVSQALFDFHGQHDGISLLKKATHLAYLDGYLKLDAELLKLGVVYQDLKKTEESLKFLDENKKNKESRLELLNYEIKEIEDAGIKDGEDEELKNEIKVYENIEKIMSSINEVYSIFGGETGLTAKLKVAKNQLDHVSEVDQSFNKMANDLSDIYYQIEDIYNEISVKKDKYEYDPKKFDELIERSELVEKLKRKYGGSVHKAREYLAKVKSELQLITFSAEESEKLNNKLNELKKQYLALAMAISRKRKEGSINLEKRVKEELQQLAMADVEFKINIDVIINDSSSDYIELDGKKVKYSSNGIDNIEFLISPNKGEPLKSLIKIASGGELSRIILALKSVLVENDNINTMIFDEIDAGIGGKVALFVGKSLKKLAKYKQIICITHLPQIAATGNRNLVIQKKVISNRTVSIIDVVDKDKKINEIARMLAGNITDVSLQHANELIKSLE